jgi:hypothetical protein
MASGELVVKLEFLGQAFSDADACGRSDLK